MQYAWRFSILMGLLLIGVRQVGAQDMGQIRERLGAIELSVKELQAAQRDRGATVADAASQVEQIRSEFVTVQGSIDAVAQQLRMFMEEMNRVRADIDQRLTAIEEQLRIGGGRPAGTSAPPPGGASPPGTAATTLPGNEALEYQKALSQVHGGDYISAIATFRKFLQTYPKGALAPNAQYWIAECYYAQKDYQRAIKEYQIVVERYGRHEKANAALLKQGLAFETLGMVEEAKLFLQKLVARAPNSPEAKKGAERLKVLTAQKSNVSPRH